MEGLLFLLLLLGCFVEHSPGPSSPRVLVTWRSESRVLTLPPYCEEATVTDDGTAVVRVLSSGPLSQLAGFGPREARHRLTESRRAELVQLLRSAMDHRHVREEERAPICILREPGAPEIEVRMDLDYSPVEGLRWTEQISWPNPYERSSRSQGYLIRLSAIDDFFRSLFLE